MANNTDTGTAGARQFIFSILPYLSSDGGSDPSRAFGFYYKDSDGDKQTESEASEFSLRALRESGDDFRVNASNAALKWALENGQLIFETIFNLEIEDEQTRNALKFVRLEEVDDRLQFTLEETTPGIVTASILWRLRDNVDLGGDTWDCGGFGDIDVPGGCLARLSLGHYCVPSSYRHNWVPPIPEKVPEDDGGENENGVTSLLSNVGGVLHE